MINITQLRALAQQCIHHTDLTHYIWVTTESELSRKMPNLKVSEFPMLIVVTPSFDVNAKDTDNVRDIATLLFFVLKYGRFQSENEGNQISDMDQTLNITSVIKNYLINGFPDNPDCELINGIIPHSFHIDPEFNYLGCNGWSMSFQIST